MSITSAELIWRQPSVVSDAGTNGGRMTSTQITTAVKNNIFPDVSQAERTAGSTKYRKVFVHVANDDDLQLIAPVAYVESRTPGDDAVMFIAGTQRDTQVNLTGSEQKYGSGQLNANVSAAATTITVATEGAAFNYFPAGMKIRISDKANINGVGNEEFKTVSTCNYAGNVATLVLTTALANSYLASNTKVASVYSPSDVGPTISSFVVTGSGTYNSATFPVLGDSIGTIEQDWTLTFTNATTYTISGDVVGSLGTFNVSTDASPSNPAFSKPYFTVRAVGFGGVFSAGNTITFKTSPAAIPLWYVRVIPAGASSLSSNSVIVAVEGESA